MMKRLFTDPALRAALLTVALVSVPTALVLGPDSFLLMLARSFMRQWVFLLVGLVGLFALRRMLWPACIAGLGAIMVHVAAGAPVSLPNAAPLAGHDLRIGQFNVLQPNRNKHAIIAAAISSGADILSFQEVDAEWALALENALEGTFPHRRVLPRNDCYGIALFSRIPFEMIETIDLLGAPAVHAVCRMEQGPISITAVHARSPFPYSAFAKRNKQLELLATKLGEERIPRIVFGDLNAVSWDGALLAFRERVGLCAGPDPEAATFPNAFGTAMIPIDHILGTRELLIDNLRTIHLPGSDHRALIADVSIRTK